MIFGETYAESQARIAARPMVKIYWAYAWLPVLLRDGRYAWLQSVFCKETVVKNYNYHIYSSGPTMYEYDLEVF